MSVKQKCRVGEATQQKWWYWYLSTLPPKENLPYKLIYTLSNTLPTCCFWQATHKQYPIYKTIWLYWLFISQAFYTCINDLRVLLFVLKCSLNLCFSTDLGFYLWFFIVKSSLTTYLLILSMIPFMHWWKICTKDCYYICLQWNYHSIIHNLKYHVSFGVFSLMF